MTCDKLNGKLETIANNNNNVAETAKPEKYHMNGVKTNGSVVMKKSAPEVTIVDEEELETRKSLVILATIFITAFIALFYIYKNFPKLDE